jgi:putative flippase GtrA
LPPGFSTKWKDTRREPMIKGVIGGLERRFAIFRAARFALASGIGFLIAEALLVLGVIFFYHTTSVPSFAYSSADVLGLDALAFGIGVTAAFVINERVTVNGKGEERRRGRANWAVRWGKYQLASLLGNVLIVGIQLALLATVSLSPVYGSVVGAIVTYPVTYVVSMHFVWKVRPLGN